MWGNTWPSAGLLPNEGYGLAGPVHPRKCPGVRTPDLDLEAPNLLPKSKCLDVTQVGCTQPAQGRRLEALDKAIFRTLG